MHLLCFNISECLPNFMLLDGNCIPVCPEKYYSNYYDYKRKSENAEDLILGTNQCLPCHYTCKQCNGSNDYECVECFPDAVIFNKNKEEFYCYPNSFMRDIDLERWYFRMVIFLLIVSLAVIIVWLWKCFAKRRQGRNFIHSDALQNIRHIERSVKNAVYSDSD